jgi:hypothetical protein
MDGNFLVSQTFFTKNEPIKSRKNDAFGIRREHEKNTRKSLQTIFCGTIRRKIKIFPRGEQEFFISRKTEAVSNGYIF